MKKFSLRVITAMLLCVLLLTLMAGCTQAQKKPAPKKIATEPIIRLYVNETGQVKRLKMEEYIQGVVAAEMDTKWPVNALAAQAILARTFTLKEMQDKGGVPKHKTDASTSVQEFQAYDPTKINDNVRKAVEMTRGQVVKHQGRYIKAWFSACDGGTEASASEGLAYNRERTPYIKSGVKDGCMSITVPENKHWTASFPLDVVRSTVRSVTGADPGNINAANVSIAKRGPSGRAEVLQLGSTKVGGPALRLALGNEKMRSIYLDGLWVEGDSLVMAGKGYGHGVGMCQWGARKMAQEGKKPEQIVKFYFKGVTIDKLWK